MSETEIATLESDPEVKQLLDAMEKTEKLVVLKRLAIRKQALENIPKFVEATKQYLNATTGLKLPQCYIETLAQYIRALKLYMHEERIGKCSFCDFNIGLVMAITMPPEETTTAEETKKINIYDTSPGAEKNAQEVTAAAEDQKEKANIEKKLTEEQPGNYPELE